MVRKFINHLRKTSTGSSLLVFVMFMFCTAVLGSGYSSGGGGGAAVDAANTWSGIQTFLDGKLRIGDSAGDHFITIETNTNEAADYSLIVPDLAASDTLMTLATSQTVTGVKTMSSTSGNTIRFSMTGLQINDTGGDHVITFTPSGNEASGRTLNIPLMGGTGTMPVTLDVQFTDVSTGADTNPTNAFSYTLPANVMLVNGRTVHYRVHGSTAANANGKTVSLHIGTTEVYNTGAVAANNQDWDLELTFTDTGSNTQDWTVRGVYGGALVAASGTTTKTDTTSNVIKAQLTNSVANAGDITAKTAECWIQ